MNSFSDSLVPNPCLIAILLTISTHNGPQFILHYPPKPDNHDYKAASFRTPWQDFSSSSSSYSDASSDASGNEINSSDSDEIATNDNSDYDVPNNYNNILSHKGPARQHYSTNNSVNNLSTDSLKKSFKGTGLSSGTTLSRMSNQPQKPKLTRSERNPLSPTLKSFTDDIQKLYKEENFQYFPSNIQFDLTDDFYDINPVDGLTVNLTSNSNEKHQKHGEDLKIFSQRKKKNQQVTNFEQRNKRHEAVNFSNSKNFEPIRKEQRVFRKGPKTITPKFILEDKNFILQSEDRDANIDNLTIDNASHPDFTECSASSPNLEKTMPNQDSSTSHGKATITNETVLGFDTTFLCELLVPPRDMCNTLFELAVDDMVFLGMPVHVRRDGQWLRKKTSRKNSNNKCLSNQLPNNNDPTGVEKKFSFDYENGPIDKGTEADDENDISLSQVSGCETEKLGSDVLESKITLDMKNGNSNTPISSGPDQNYGTIIDGENEKKFKSVDNFSFSSHSQGLNTVRSQTKTHEFTDAKSDMRMFHVSFVVNPPVREFPERISQMYQCIASRFARMLRYEQAKSNYVWNEILLILEARDKALQEGASLIECWDKISKSSSLAAAIGQLYDSISRSEIAKFTLNHKLHSLQIPIITQVDSLPSVSQKVFSGTELSTLPPFDALYDERNPKIQSFALLLLDDPYNIIRDFRLNEDSSLAILLYKISPTEIKISKAIKTLVKNDIQQGELLKDAQSETKNVTSSKVNSASSTSNLVVKNLHTGDLKELKNPNVSQSNAQTSAITIPNTATTTINLRTAGTGTDEIYFKVPISNIKADSVIQQTSQYSRRSNFEDSHVKSHFSASSDLRNEAPLMSHVLTDGTSLKKVNVAGLSFTHYGSWAGSGTSNSNTNFKVNQDLSCNRENSRSKFSFSTSVPTTTQIANNIGAKASILSSSQNSKTQFGIGTNFLRRSKLTNGLSDDISEEENISPSDEWSEDTIIQDPRSATALQMRWIEKLLENIPPNVALNFRKTLKYMDGQTPMEWAILHESISSKEFYELLNCLNDNLIIVRHW